MERRLREEGRGEEGKGGEEKGGEGRRDKRTEKEGKSQSLKNKTERKRREKNKKVMITLQKSQLCSGICSELYVLFWVLKKRSKAMKRLKAREKGSWHYKHQHQTDCSKICACPHCKVNIGFLSPPTSTALLDFLSQSPQASLSKNVNEAF